MFKPLSIKLKYKNHSANTERSLNTSLNCHKSFTSLLSKRQLHMAQLFHREYCAV